MSRRIPALVFTLAILLSSLGAAVITHVPAYAMGAPTENYTIPEPEGDTQHSEIKPPVTLVLQGATAQPSDAPPGLIAGLWGKFTAGGHKVSGDEQWYLDVDINTPGWLYIYEYYPSGGESQGKWIAYKWQLLEPGRWRLGPFWPGEDELVGQHIYRFFFYGNGQWATGGTQKSDLVYWDYEKGTGENTQAVSTPAAVPPVSPGDQFIKFITNPVTLLIAPSIIVLIVLMGWLVRRSLRERRYPQNEVNQPLVELLEKPSAPARTQVRGTALATLELPNGQKIRLGGESEIIGRAHIARSLGLDELGAISKRHFRISFEEGKPFIEDMDSANGTTVNGRDIRGAGLVDLHDGDVIEMAGKASIKLRSDQ